MEGCVREVSRIFVSYSRKDQQHAERIAEQLKTRGYEVLLDLDDILPTEPWRDRLQQLIEEADAVVFLLSPSSAASEVCSWEVEVASELGKKIAPIVIADVSGVEIPPLLARLNYIFATKQDRLDNAVASLCDALSATGEWLREYTGLTERALQWTRAAHDPKHLLDPDQLSRARSLLARRPNEVGDVAYVVETYLAASEAYGDLRSDYTRQRLRALTELVEPLLHAHIEKLEDEIATYKKLPTRMWNATIVRIEGEIAAVRNFAAEGGRWHPAPAIHHKTLGAAGGYCEIYCFPCCGHYASLDDPGVPQQFGYDGCEAQP